MPSLAALATLAYIGPGVGGPPEFRLPPLVLEAAAGVLQLLSVTGALGALAFTAGWLLVRLGDSFLLRECPVPMRPQRPWPPGAR